MLVTAESEWPCGMDLLFDISLNLVMRVDRRVIHSEQDAPYKILKMHHTSTIHTPYMHHTYTIHALYKVLSNKIQSSTLEEY